MLIIKKNEKKKIKIQHFLDSDKPRMLFFLLIYVKMPIIVGTLTFKTRKKNSCSAELSRKYLMTSGPDAY